MNNIIEVMSTEDWVEKAFSQKINQNSRIFLFNHENSAPKSEPILGTSILKSISSGLVKQKQSLIRPKLVPVIFPEAKFYDNADQYYEKVWSAIDGASSHIWVVMYHFDDTSIGTITLYKLIEAAKRGVKVCLMHDVLTCHLHFGMMETLRSHNGIVHRLNELYRIWNMPGREYFKRDHEKLIVADGKLFLGSANISEDYASTISLSRSKTWHQFFLRLQYGRLKCMS